MTTLIERLEQKGQDASCRAIDLDADLMHRMLAESARVVCCVLAPGKDDEDGGGDEEPSKEDEITRAVAATPAA